MKLILQRCSEGNVEVAKQTLGSIGNGLVVLLGLGEGDTEEVVKKLLEKMVKLRIFSDEEDKFNHSLMDIGGEVLLVSQFTLYSNCKKGNRPSFTEALEPKEAQRLYEYAKTVLKDLSVPYSCGEFGASMKVSLVNEGPVTIILDSKEL